MIDIVDVVVFSCGLLYTGFVLQAVLPQFRKLFFKKYGRRHRLCGLVLLAWLLVGLTMLLCMGLENNDSEGSGNSIGSGRESSSSSSKSTLARSYIIYDAVLGILGVLTALTAAQDFALGHDKVSNV
jgi:hypothetical protein